MFKSLVKAALGVITVPVAVVADCITLGGLLIDKPKPHTYEACKSVMKNLENAAKPESKQ